MKLLSLLILILFLVTSCNSPEGSENNSSKPDLDSLANYLTKEKEIPSIAIGIVKDGKVVLETAYGYANLEEQIPADEKTLYQLGSITKIFTGRVLAHLVAEEKMSLNDTLANYFPGTNFPRDTEGKEITIRDVATHSGEFPAYPANLQRIDPDPIRGFSKEELLKGIEMMKMDTAIGSQFYYSNFGYGVLATAMENSTNKSLSELMQEYILSPYNMENTSLFINDKVKERLAVPYLDVTPNTRTEPWEMGAMAGSGNMFSSISDLNMLILNLLTDDTINRIQQGRHFKFPNHENWYYGLGVFIVDSKKWNTEAVFHGSDIDGYAGNLQIYPEHNFGYAILTNWGEGDAVRESITAIDQAIRSFYLESELKQDSLDGE